MNEPSDAYDVDEAMKPGRAEREAEAARALGVEDGAISERAVYVGSSPAEGMVETICAGCGKTAHIPETLVPPELTQRPVMGVCPKCRP